MAKQRDGGRVLHHAGGWDDRTLAEKFISAPGNVELILILNERPLSRRAAEFLEMRATFTLLPGAALWVDGQTQADHFRPTSRSDKT